MIHIFANGYLAALLVAGVLMAPAWVPLPASIIGLMIYFELRREHIALLVERGGPLTIGNWCSFYASQLVPSYGAYGIGYLIGYLAT